MKTCTQISDSEFRVKISVVSPTKRASPPPYKHPLVLVHQWLGRQTKVFRWLQARFPSGTREFLG